MKRIIAALISAVFCIGEACSLEIFPGNILLRGMPGERIEKKITLKNESSETVHLALEFSPQEFNKKEYREWIKVSKKSIKIKPKMSKIIKLACEVPSITGELEGSLLIRNVSKKNEVYEIRYRQPIVLQIKGTEVSQVSISDFKIKEDGQNFFIEASVANDGNISVTPKLVCELTSNTGEKINKIFDTGITPIPPQSKQMYTTKFLNGKRIEPSKSMLSLFFHDSDGALKIVTRPIEYQSMEKKQ